MPVIPGLSGIQGITKLTTEGTVEIPANPATYFDLFLPAIPMWAGSPRQNKCFATYCSHVML